MSDAHPHASVIQAFPSHALDALEENLVEHVTLVPRSLGGARVSETRGLVLVDSGLSSETFNGILRARLDASDADEAIDAALDHFRSVDRPFTWWVGPASRPDDLEGRLGERGLQPLGERVGMTLALDELPREPPLPEGLVLRRLTRIEHLQHFTSLLSNPPTQADDAVLAYYERAAPILFEASSPLQLFVAYDADEPAAAVEILQSPHAGNPRGFAGVHLCTAAEHRPGLELTISRAALDHARGNGATLGGILVAPEAQLPFSELGFQPVGRFAEFQP